MWPDHCVQESYGSHYHEGVVRKDTDHEVLKGKFQWIESYSAFGGDGEDTGMVQYLSSKNITKVYVVGLAFDYCVGSTAVDAAKNGYDTTIIKDATRAVALESQRDMEERLMEYGVK